MFMPVYEPPEDHVEDSINMETARENFLKRDNIVLYELVKSRYAWMNEYIRDTDKIIYEVGCGIGVSKEFITNPNVILTDVLDNPWVDKYLDALNMDMPDDSVDVFICSNVIHHFASPYKFLTTVNKKLKVGGRLLLFEPYTGVILKMAQRIMRLEGWNDRSDVFSPETVCNVPGKPWSANNSIPKLLFQNKEKFNSTFTNLKVYTFQLSECFLFILSGGVNFKTWHPNLSQKSCDRIKKIDKFLVKMMPQVFAMGCRAVIVKK